MYAPIISLVVGPQPGAENVPEAIMFPAYCKMQLADKFDPALVYVATGPETRVYAGAELVPDPIELVEWLWADFLYCVRR